MLDEVGQKINELSSSLGTLVYQGGCNLVAIGHAVELQYLRIDSSNIANIQTSTCKNWSDADGVVTAQILGEISEAVKGAANTVDEIHSSLSLLKQTIEAAESQVRELLNNLMQ